MGNQGPMQGLMASAPQGEDPSMGMGAPPGGGGELPQLLQEAAMLSQDPSPEAQQALMQLLEQALMMVGQSQGAGGGMPPGDPGAGGGMPPGV